MRSLSYIILLLVCSNFVAQNNFVIINGAVLSSSNNEHIENAIINLKLEGGYWFEQKTDTSGKYEFKFKINGPSTCTVSISTNKITKSNLLCSTITKQILSNTWKNMTSTVKTKRTY